MVVDLGRHRALIMRNHGLLTCGSSAALAIIIMKYLVSCCRTQLLLEASGTDIVVPPADVCEEAAQRWDAQYAKGPPAAEWAAMLRMLDRLDASYRS
jgi:ribulose-5-phosphate 4-epimerase/fuculose-1-phosphate aldolase